MWGSLNRNSKARYGVVLQQQHSGQSALALSCIANYAFSRYLSTWDPWHNLFMWDMWIVLLPSPMPSSSLWWLGFPSSLILGSLFRHFDSKLIAILQDLMTSFSLNSQKWNSLWPRLISMWTAIFHFQRLENELAWESFKPVQSVIKRGKKKTQVRPEDHSILHRSSPLCWVGEWEF